MNEEGVERRLTAILAADVVGYSRLMAANEDAQLRHHHMRPRRQPALRRLGDQDEQLGLRTLPLDRSASAGNHNSGGWYQTCTPSRSTC